MRSRGMGGGGTARSMAPATGGGSGIMFGGSAADGPADSEPTAATSSTATTSTVAVHTARHRSACRVLVMAVPPRRRALRR
ncbi:hypothetical protein [Gordonia sp. SMJS1]|uniref:hypothetical protein n=1 Tax=Gordonia sp. SMJS1 TaxID=3039400 RepID=UPI002454CA38|nr:hypothetical protein [Gordonia sp. SMJS1]WGJ88015.1 hypothetical protein QAD21_03405 [Gordonia sp. SMJS1]